MPKALTVTENNLQQFIEQGPTQQELVAAKKNILGSFALTLDSNKKIANALAIMAFYHLPIDYIDTYKQNVNAVTTKQIKTAFGNLLGEQKLVTVVVGDDG